MTRNLRTFILLFVSSIILYSIVAYVAVTDRQSEHVIVVDDEKVALGGTWWRAETGWYTTPPAQSEAVRVPEYTWRAERDGAPRVTYLKEFIVKTPGSYVIKIENVPGLKRVFVNGTPLAPAFTEQRSGGNPTTWLLNTSFNTNMLALQIERDGPFAVGINEHIYVGPFQQMWSFDERKKTAESVLMAASMIFGCYFMLLSLMRWRIAHYLFLGLYCFMFGLYISVDGEQPLFMFFVHPNDWAVHYIFVISSQLMFFCFIKYFSSYFAVPRLTKGKWRQEYALIAFTVVALSVLPLWPTETMMTLLFVNLATLLVIAVKVMIALQRHRNYDFTLIASYIILFHLHSLQWLDNVFFLHADGWKIAAFFSFTILQAYIISLQANKLHGELNDVVAQIEQINRNKETLLTRTTHELKTPINGIANFTALMSEQLPATDRFAPMAYDMEQTSQRLTFLIQDLLDLQREKMKMLHLHMQPLRLDRLVQALIALFQDAHSVIFSWRKQAEPLVVYGDEQRLTKLLYHLFVQYIIDEKTPFISLHIERRGEIWHIMMTGDSTHELNDERHIHPASLQMAHLLMTKMGGTFQQTKQQRELRTVLTLQSAELPATTALVADEDALEKQRRSGTILLVDDEYTNVASLREALQQEGYTLILAYSGYEALHRLAEHDIDLVIVDLMMPQMDGLELTRRIRQQYSHIERPILMLTALDSNKEKAAALASGCNEWLTKPVPLSILRGRIQSLLQLKFASNEAVVQQLQFLKAQIIPHFLFNTLNSILAMSYIDLPKAQQLVQDFTRYLQAKLNVREVGELVPLQDELDFIELYLQIEQVRFGETLQYEIISDSAPTVQIPPLTLQTLVENAVNHGISKKSERGIVRIAVERLNSETVITIEDDGVGMSAERIRQTEEAIDVGVGMQNAKYRLASLCKAKFLLSSVEGVGTKITINIPD